MSKVNELVLYLTDAVKRVDGFVAEQAPLYIQEYLSFHFIDNVIGVIFFAMLLCAVIAVGRYCISKVDKSDRPLVCIIAGFVSIMLLFPLACCVLECVKVKVAPRVAIMEHLIDLTKGDK